jgi:4-hydroxy-tetrahydrodipicolinate synthase
MFQGSFVAIVTPFRNEAVDFETLAKLIEFQIENGTDGIIPCGTTGESATLSHEEHDQVVEFVVRKVNRRIKVIAGAGSNSFREALRLTRHAQEVGADGALVITPYYNKPTQRGMLEHFGRLAKETEIPLVLYNVPARTGVCLDPQIVAQLAKVPRIVAIKEATGSVDQVNQILDLCDITVLSGDDMLTFPIMAVGGKGVISVAANVLPREVSRMVHAALEGRWDEGRKIHFQLYKLFKAMFIETNPIPAKTALALMGKISEEFRLPLCSMEEGNRARLIKVLEAYRLI